MRSMLGFGRFTLALVACAVFASPLLAGAPLVCWKVDTGAAPSLPWTDSPKGAEGAKQDYDTARLAADTLRLLDGDSSVLAHMETLRRAALYSAHDEKAGGELLTQLVQRVGGPGAATPADALERFDAGYFVESWNQAEGRNLPGFWNRMMESLGFRAGPSDPLNGASGYDWVREAIRLRGGDPAMEYAAALITCHPRRPEHDGHVVRAADGAVRGSPLEENLLERFGDRGRTLADLRLLSDPKN